MRARITESNVGRTLITDANVIDALNHLFTRGFGGINRDDHVITFQRWSGGRANRGIAFSIDARAPDDTTIHFLTRLEPLSEKSWYFYISDFNVWQRRHLFYGD